MSIANGVIYTPKNNDGLVIANGLPETECNGLHIVNGIRNASYAFPGWTEVDSNGIITVDDASILGATWTISNSDRFQEALTPHAAYVDAGSLFWTGDFELRYVVNIDYANSTATIDTYTGLAEDTTTPNGWATGNKDTLTCTSTHVGGVTCYQKATEVYGGAFNTLASGLGMGNQSGVDVYVKLRRVGTKYYIDTYVNDSTFGTPTDSVNESLDGSVEPYRYLYAFQAANAGAAGDLSGTIRIISISPSPWS